MTANNENTLDVSLVIYQHVLATSLTLPLEMLSAGEAFASRYDKSTIKLKTQLLGQDDKPITSRACIQFLPDITLDNSADEIDKISVPNIILLPSLWRNPRPVLRKHPILIEWLKYCWQQGTTIIGVGTGVCFLAESGLLDGHMLLKQSG